jgi:hypothetical protein
VIIYPAARSRLWHGDLDVMADPLAALLVGESFVADPVDVFVSDLAVDAVIGLPVPIVVIDVIDGAVLAEPITFPLVDDTFSGVVVCQWSGDAITSMLIGAADRRADAVPIHPTPGNGGDVTFTFVDYLLKI